MYRSGQFPILPYLISAILLVGPALRSQQPAPPPPSKTPQDLMADAIKLNNLTTPGTAPWHIKSSWQILDDKGAVTDEGTYEELWLSPNRYKRTFTGKTFSQTDYGTEKGFARSGTQDDAPALLLDLRRELVEPLFYNSSDKAPKLTIEPMEAKAMNLLCLKTGQLPRTGITSCVGANQPVLRVTSDWIQGLQILHNRILPLQDHFVPGDLRILREGKTVATANIESVQLVDTANAPDLTPTADSVPMPRRIRIHWDQVVDKPHPKVSSRALEGHLSGTVVLDVLVSTSGTVKKVRVLSGPKDLQQGALETVSMWRFFPPKDNGEPVEASGTIQINYNIH